MEEAVVAMEVGSVKDVNTGVTTPKLLVIVTETCEIRVVTTGCTTVEEPMAVAVKVGKWVGLTVKITSFEVTTL